MRIMYIKDGRNSDYHSPTIKIHTYIPRNEELKKVGVDYGHPPSSPKCEHQLSYSYDHRYNGQK